MIQHAPLPSYPARLAFAAILEAPTPFTESASSRVFLLFVVTLAMRLAVALLLSRVIRLN